MAVPYTFGSATSSIPLSQLDSNFATAITLGTTNVYLGNTTTTLNGLTLSNVTISSGNVTITSVTITNANITGTTTLSGLTASTALALDASKNIVSVTNTGTGNNVLAASPSLTGTVTIATLNLTNALGTGYGGTGLTSYTANGVLYASSSSALTSGSALTFSGSALSVTGSIASTTGVTNTNTNSTLNSNLSAVSDVVRTDVLSYGSTDSSTLFGTTRASYSVLLSQSGNGMMLGTFNSTPVIFGVNNAEAMRLTSTGLGIGTSSPAQKLDVSGTIQSQYNAATNDATVGAYNFYNTNSNASANPIRASIVAGRENSAWGAYLDFYTSTGTSAQSSKMRLDSSGNLGLGVTPSGWNSVYRALNIGSRGLIFSRTDNDETVIGVNWYRNTGASYVYTANGYASYYLQTNGAHAWLNAPNNTSGAGATATFTQAMTLDASGNLLVGRTSGTGARIDVYNSGSGDATIRVGNAQNGFTNSFGKQGGTAYGANAIGDGFVYADSSLSIMADNGTGVIKFSAGGNTERARIDSSGNLLVGTTNNGSSAKIMCNGGLAVQTSGNGNRSMLVNLVSNENFNGAGTAIYVGRDGTTSRSINAGGTVNASGADYAEYMTKAGDFTVAKGDVVGIDAQGKLTNVFADAVSFVVKSTDPSYVGGDTWGVGFDDDTEGLEAARQTVDRIAFAGQVPVNVLGATAGQYIVPVNDNGAIKGVAKNEADLTMSDYIKSVGKVIAIEADGRARIIVKVA